VWRGHDVIFQLRGPESLAEPNLLFTLYRRKFDDTQAISSVSNTFSGDNPELYYKKSLNACAEKMKAKIKLDSQSARIFEL
jgi:hypothetical protein